MLKQFFSGVRRPWPFRRRPMTLERLLKRRARRGLTADDVVRYLDDGGDPGGPNAAGTTLLHLAAEDGEAETIRLLAGRGADVNAPDRFGQTPLHMAVASDCDTAPRDGLRTSGLPTALVLLRLGADPGARAADDRTPRDFAAGYGVVQAFDELLDVIAAEHREKAGGENTDGARTDRSK